MRNEAYHAWSAAQHLHEVTYHILQEPRLLMAVMQNLHQAWINGMDVLWYDAQVKAGVTQLSEEKQIRLFEKKFAKKYRIDANMLNTMKEIRAIIQQHKGSALEFTRHGRVVICDDAYNLEIVDKERTQRYVQETKRFVDCLYEVKADV